MSPGRGGRTLQKNWGGGGGREVKGEGGNTRAVKEPFENFPSLEI